LPDVPINFNLLLLLRRKEMPTTLEVKTPRLVTALPGPNAKRILEQDAKFMSPSYTRDYPLVAKRGHGAIVEDVDGNAFLDFAAGIAVCSTGHCHPKVVSAIQKAGRRADSHVWHGLLLREHAATGGAAWPDDARS